MLQIFTFNLIKKLTLNLDRDLFGKNSHLYLADSSLQTVSDTARRHRGESVHFLLCKQLIFHFFDIRPVSRPQPFTSCRSPSCPWRWMTRRVGAGVRTRGIFLFLLSWFQRVQRVVHQRQDWNDVSWNTMFKAASRCAVWLSKVFFW